MNGSSPSPLCLSYLDPNRSSAQRRFHFGEVRCTDLTTMGKEIVLCSFSCRLGTIHIDIVGPFHRVRQNCHSIRKYLHIAAIHCIVFFTQPTLDP